METEIVIRPYKSPDDDALIYATWCRSLFYEGDHGGIKTRKAFFKEMTEYIRRNLQRWKIKIACLTDDPDTILGYAVIDDDLLEWVFVKYALRQQGIANLLLRHERIKFCREMTKIGKELALKLNIKGIMDGGTNQRTDSGTTSGTRIPENSETPV